MVLSSGADCGCGQLHHTVTENRADCDHGHHRPATGTPTPTKKLSPIVSQLQFRLRSRARAALAQQGCRLEIHAPWTTGACCASARPFGRWCGHLPQEGGREVGRSVLLKFVYSSSTTTRKGSWFFVTPLAGGVVIGQGGSTSPDKRQVP